MAQLGQQPGPLDALALRRGDWVDSSVVAGQEIEQRADGDEPAAETGKPFHQYLEARVQLPVLPEVLPKVGVHDARTPFAHQPVLILL